MVIHYLWTKVGNYWQITNPFGDKVKFWNSLYFTTSELQESVVINYDNNESKSTIKKPDSYTQTAGGETTSFSFHWTVTDFGNIEVKFADDVIQVGGQGMLDNATVINSVRLRGWYFPPIKVIQ